MRCFAAKIASLLLLAACTRTTRPLPSSPATPASPSPASTDVDAATASPLSPVFHLVAARADRLTMQRAGDRVVLVGTVPYPVASDGAIQRLDGVHRGLLPPDPTESIDTVALAGGFTGAGDGWLVLQATSLYKPHALRGVPIAYQWLGDGWKPLRVRRGRVTETYDALFVRGETVFAATHYDLLPDLQAVFVPLRTRPVTKPASAWVRLRGGAPAPRDPTDLCSLTPYVGGADGTLHAIGGTCPSGSPARCASGCTVVLLSWLPEATEPAVTSLPDSPVGIDRLDGRELAVATAADEVLVFGATPGRGDDSSYLAVGSAGSLRRLGLARDDLARGPVRSATRAADGTYWLVLDSGLWQHHEERGLQPVPVPKLEWPDLEEWYWDDAWHRTGADAKRKTRQNPVQIDEVLRVGDTLWLHGAVADPTYHRPIEAVFKSGPHRPPEALPSNRRLLGEIGRHEPSTRVVRLFHDSSAAQLRSFEAGPLQRLRARDDVVQVYIDESGHVLAVMARPEQNGRASTDLAAQVGGSPEFVHPPPQVARMLWDRAAPGGAE